jgi:hypothetical protein
MKPINTKCRVEAGGAYSGLQMVKQLNGLKPACWATIDVRNFKLKQ